MADILIDTKVQKTGLLYKLPFANQLVRPRGSWKKRFFIVKVTDARTNTLPVPVRSCATHPCTPASALSLCIPSSFTATPAASPPPRCSHELFAVPRLLRVRLGHIQHRRDIELAAPSFCFVADPCCEDAPSNSTTPPSYPLLGSYPHISPSLLPLRPPASSGHAPPPHAPLHRPSSLAPLAPLFPLPATGQPKTL